MTNYLIDESGCDTMAMNHDTYMWRCIQLAKKGQGFVSPNPMVGAVVVHNNIIVGEGFHQQYGEAHAEVNAVKDVQQRLGSNAVNILQHSTMFVSLEPCAHFGKTPPCADLIIRHGIPQVVVGAADPFKQVNGAGIQKLQDAGVQVTTGILHKECEWLNRRFLTHIKKHRPYIILKWAETADGFFAPVEKKQRWISCQAAKVLAHKWRAEEDAVLVGKATAAIDNPQLNVREYPGRNPRRVILNFGSPLPPHLHVFDGSQPTIIVSDKADVGTKDAGCIYINPNENGWVLNLLLQLSARGIQSLIVEGGIKTLQAFINAGLWDEARIFTGKTLWGRGQKAPLLHGTLLNETRIDTDNLKIITNPDSFPL